MFTKILTRSGEDDDPNPVGMGFYYIIENSKYKRRTVFYDRDGKAVCTGWMMW